MKSVPKDGFIRTEQILYPLANTIGGTIIQSRVPIFALTTAFTCVVSACLFARLGLWAGSAAFLSISAMLGFWQIHIVCNSPILVVRAPIVTLYRRRNNACSYALSDLLIVEGNLTIAVALFTLVLASAMFGALGISRDLETALSLRLSLTQRLILNTSGIWFAGAAISLSYLDLPRRKLLLRDESRRPRVIYFDSRQQRKKLLIFLRARQLEQVMLRVGLDPNLRITTLCDTESPHNRGNGPTP